jgi:hypothetical protein
MWATIIVTGISILDAEPPRISTRWLANAKDQPSFESKEAGPGADSAWPWCQQGESGIFQRHSHTLVPLPSSHHRNLLRPADRIAMRPIATI